jgi:hypothetical protein
MMVNATTSVASGHCARDRVMHPSVFFHRTTGGAIASACIVALSLVAAPPDVNGARTEVREVKLAAFAVLSAAPLAETLEKFIRNQAQTVAPITNVAVGGAADIPAAVVKTSASGVTTALPSEPATSPQKDAAALTATTTAFDVGAIFGPLINNAVVGPIVLFGAIAFGLLVILPVGWFVQTIYEVVASFLGLPLVLAVPATLASTAEANVTTGPALTSDPILSDPARITTATAAPADGAPATGTAKGDGSIPLPSPDTEPATAKEPATGTQQMPTETATLTNDVTETVEVEEVSTEPADSTGRSATPRLVEGGSMKVGEQLTDPTQPGNGDRPDTRTDAGGDPSATEGSPSTGSPSGGDATGGDAGGS